MKELGCFTVGGSLVGSCLTKRASAPPSLLISVIAPDGPPAYRWYWITNALEASSGPDETEHVQLKGSGQGRPAPPCQFAVDRRRSPKTGTEATRKRKLAILQRKSC
jgi:hypothetical protein